MRVNQSHAPGAPDITCVHIPFDDYGSELETDFSPDAWKAGRQQAFKAVAAVLTKHVGQPGHGCMVLVDDNMHLRSMRKDVWHLARQHRAAFVQLYLPCSLDQALQRNSRRPPHQQVPLEVIQRMSERLEAPRPEQYAWERHTVTHSTAENNASGASRCCFEGPVPGMGSQQCSHAC
ncbi:hypothetical protein WJX73_000675 [Symbiochloris irregularis]|uniref:Uncharacterized protein n=1 Tax=Symbiochloris irregularis TaxID=706552 RepID=A0AAW1P985_9CHLO